MREIVLDTETTGLDPDSGDRIVEIGALELLHQMPTGQTFHVYLNPGRPMSREAFEIHGLADDFLRDKPPFAAVAEDFLRFIGDARLVIHNAGFDMKFLNAELRQHGYPVLSMARVVDTLVMARTRFPGAPVSLDALCRRFGIDNSARTRHGALLDSEILAEVYLELRGGRQPGLALARAGSSTAAVTRGTTLPRRANPLPTRLTDAERAAHADFVDSMGDAALWRRFS